MGSTTAVSAALCAVLCIILIPHLGLYGASVATLLAMIVVNDYRRIKVAKFTKLLEDRSEQVLTLVSIVGVFIFYYLSAYGAGIWSAIACLAIALAFSVFMNADILRKLISAHK